MRPIFFGGGSAWGFLADRDSSEVPNALSYAAQPTSIATTRSVPLAFGVPRPTPAPAPTSAPHGHSDRVRGDRAH
jgi:hypothetical protein